MNSPRLYRTVSKKALEAEPYLIWNAFVDLVATESTDALNDIQRLAHLAFWYDAELNNGGHLQYFENRGAEHLDQTLDALQHIGASRQADILSRAAVLWRSQDRQPIETVEEFVDEALQSEFVELDNEYYSIEPHMTEHLEKYCNKHVSEFIRFVE